MFSTQNRLELREHFFRSWDKAQRGEPLDGLEKMIATVVAQHPEYHAVVAHPEAYVDRDYPLASGETNPFLHLGMHIALHEQLTTQRPAGIVAIYQAVLAASPDPHLAEHRMMACLSEVLWQAQRTGAAPDEAAYLRCLQQSAGGQ